MTDGRPTALAHAYERALSGEPLEAVEAFHEIVGLAPRNEPARPSPPPRTVPMIEYLIPRRIDRAALLHGGREVAKFEDLTTATAAALERDLRAHGLQTVRVGPYTKRFDVAVAEAYGRGDLYCVVASRGDQAHAVVEAERDRSPEGARAAGAALGYPPCCVEAFVTAEGSERTVREGINEAAFRATRGRAGDAPWMANVLSSLAPIGFIACDVGCPRALAFAQRVLDAVRIESGAAARTLETVLRRPILFFRYPLFFVLEGEATTGAARGVRYRRALLADDGTGGHGALHALAHGVIGEVLQRGDEVTLSDTRLEVRAEGRSIARFDVASPGTPMLLRWTDVERAFG